jgi:Domain of unknown function (DUF4276)
MEIRIYFEGNKLLKSGFDKFFSELGTTAREAGCSLELVAARDGPRDYRKAARSHPQAWNILLKDSEQAMPERPADLFRRHGIDPQLTDRVFWMVQLMEAWFLADGDALEGYYGNEFQRNAIGDTADVERFPKAEVMDRLQRATRNTTKGEYHKVRHAPYLLEKLNDQRVQARSEHCRILFEAVREKLGQSRS